MKTLTAVMALCVMLTSPLMVSAGDANVEDLVKQAVALWQEKGKEAAIEAINAPIGPLRKGAIYVFACDLEGTILAHPTQKELAGHDQWELQDARGIFITQEFIKAAKSEEGFGWVEYEWIRVNETEPTKKRTLIQRIPGQEVFVGCGYYLQ